MMLTGTISLHQAKHSAPEDTDLLKKSTINILLPSNGTPHLEMLTCCEVTLF